jgi:hypothetical protein
MTVKLIIKTLRKLLRRASDRAKLAQKKSARFKKKKPPTEDFSKSASRAHFRRGMAKFDADREADIENRIADFKDFKYKVNKQTERRILEGRRAGD